MRTMICFAAVALLRTSEGFGQHVGSEVIVTVQECQMRSQNIIVATVPKGSVFRVEDVKGNWFLVRHWGRKASIKGWINRRDVVPFDRRRARARAYLIGYGAR
jgi:hypothetical protein